MNFGIVYLGIVALIFTAHAPSHLYGHGEAKLGPNGGHIRMPGAFHTELVVTGSDQDFAIYLLDVSFSNPTTEQSSVKLIYRGENTLEAKCSKNKVYFSCKFAKKINAKAGLLVVEAIRAGVAGAAATYEMPLILGAPSKN